MFGANPSTFGVNMISQLSEKKGSKTLWRTSASAPLPFHAPPCCKMAARAAMQAQMDALMGKERDIAVDKVRTHPSSACTQAPPSAVNP